MQQLVSIIMPAYNAGKHIAESIRSVLDQTYVSWELIVVDDGSADDTAEVVRAFSSTDGRVKYVFQVNGGQASARNRGISGARGELVAFLDADDLWLREKLELQISVLGESAADVVFSDGYAFYDDGSPERADFFAVVPGAMDGSTMLPLLYAYNRIATLSVIVKRQALERVGLFDESRRLQNCEDYELWLRLARAGCSFFGMSDKLVRYRRHSASTTHRESRMLKPMIEVAKKHSDCVGRTAAQRRIRELYRELITTLLSEDDLAGARENMREFAAWDRKGLITICQRILLRLSPGSFNHISRKCLYPLEWHLAQFKHRLRAA